jgi:class 3 adenylate cyclase
MDVLREYHAALGDLVSRFEGTLERFTGDGLMIVFNDPLPCEAADLRAIRMAVAMRTRIRDLAESWSRQGHDLGFGIGVAQGYATLGRIGLEGREEYTALGTVVNLAARLCAAAKPWQILVSQRVLTGIEDVVVHSPAGDLELHGFSRPIRAYDIKGVDAARVAS